MPLPIMAICIHSKSYFKSTINDNHSFYLFYGLICNLSGMFNISRSLQVTACKVLSLLKAKIGITCQHDHIATSYYM